MVALGPLVKHHPVVVASSVALALVVAAVVLLPFVLPSPVSTDPVNRLLAPLGHSVLGTDAYGRDVLSRLVSAGRASLGLAGVVTVCAVVLGSLLGLISGYFIKAGGPIMRVMDAWMAFPAIVLAMLLAVSFGASFWTEMVALVVIFTPFVARIIRSRVLSISSRPFVEAAGVAGMGHWKRLFVHVAPNVLPLMLVQVVIVAAQSLLVDGALSFLGLGIAPPTPTWGNMIAEGRAYMIQQPWLILLPGLAIAGCVLLLNLLGASLRSAMDPRARSFDDITRARVLAAKASRQPRTPKDGSPVLDASPPRPDAEISRRGHMMNPR